MVFRMFNRGPNTIIVRETSTQTSEGISNSSRNNVPLPNANVFENGYYSMSSNGINNNNNNSNSYRPSVFRRFGPRTVTTTTSTGTTAGDGLTGLRGVSAKSKTSTYSSGMRKKSVKTVIRMKGYPLSLIHI